ncbi:MAG: hypothetical protein WBL88_08265, partial [Nitrososphaeraceae archaeon]
ATTCYHERDSTLHDDNNNSLAWIPCSIRHTRQKPLLTSIINKLTVYRLIMKNPMKIDLNN